MTRVQRANGHALLAAEVERMVEDLGSVTIDWSEAIVTEPVQVSLPGLRDAFDRVMARRP